MHSQINGSNDVFTACLRRPCSDWRSCVWSVALRSRGTSSAATSCPSNSRSGTILFPFMVKPVMKLSGPNPLTSSCLCVTPWEDAAASTAADRQEKITKTEQDRNAERSKQPIITQRLFCSVFNKGSKGDERVRIRGCSHRSMSVAICCILLKAISLIQFFPIMSNRV